MTKFIFNPAIPRVIAKELRQELKDYEWLIPAVLANYAYDTISLLVPADDAPKFRESLLEELRVRHESMVQDLAHCLAGKLARLK